jgi:hypothetical protein
MHLKNRAVPARASCKAAKEQQKGKSSKRGHRTFSEKSAKCTMSLRVPDRILIAFVAELKLYGFRPAEPLFAELNAYSGAVWREGLGGATGDGRFWDRIGMDLAA